MRKLLSMLERRDCDRISGTCKSKSCAQSEILNQIAPLAQSAGCTRRASELAGARILNLLLRRAAPIIRAAARWRVQENGQRFSMTRELSEEERAEFVIEVERLRQEHRDLDAAIDALLTVGVTDHLQLQRLKKRKLVLRDRIAFLEDTLTPDIIA
jgi:hypothetical protein